MIIQVRGCNFINKGAELMLYAVVQQMCSLYSDVVLAADLRTGTIGQRRQAGLHHLAWMESKKLPWGGALSDSIAVIMPSVLRRFLNVVRFSEVDAVLDASGFAFSDQRGAARSEMMAIHAKRMKQRGKKVILLPQAFGPFEDHRIRDAVSDILRNADLVFARDALSYEYLMDLRVRDLDAQIAPDFTCSVRGEIPAYFDTSSRWACIVPNYRMLDSTSADTCKKYVPFLASCIEYLIKQDIRPFVLIHEADRDLEIASALERITERSLPIIEEPNPLYAKGMLGYSYVVVGSRYHALVSALSQGVPCLSAGWSHKYEALFKDYGCPEYLVSTLSEEEVTSKLARLIEGPTRSDVISVLKRSNQEIQSKTSQMWGEVAKCLSAG